MVLSGICRQGSNPRTKGEALLHEPFGFFRRRETAGIRLAEEAVSITGDQVVASVPEKCRRDKETHRQRPDATNPSHDAKDGSGTLVNLALMEEQNGVEMGEVLPQFD